VSSPGRTKRSAALGHQRLYVLHSSWSKSTLHEALLDLWMEVRGLDAHPSELSDADLRSYEADVNVRSQAKRRQVR